MACSWKNNTNCTNIAGKPGRIQLYDVVERCTLGTDDIGNDTVRYGEGIGSFVAYQATQNNNEYEGNLGYVDNDNQLREYTAKSNTSSNYYKISNKIAPTKVDNPYKPEGYIISNAKECESACNNNSLCTGFQFISDSKECSLATDPNNTIGDIGLNTTGINNNTYFDFPGGDLYIRTAGNSSNASCPKNSTSITSDEWAKYSRGPNMTQDTPCGVSTEIISKLGNIHEILSKGQKLITKVESNVSNLNDTDQLLTKDLEDKSDALKDIFKRYKTTYNELITYQNNGGKIELLDRMQDNSLYNLNSSKLKYTILNILAVLFIITLFFVYKLNPSASKLPGIKLGANMPKIPTLSK